MRKDALLVRCQLCGHVVIIQSIKDCTREDCREIDEAIAKGCTTEVVSTSDARKCDFGCTCSKTPVPAPETQLFTPALAPMF